MYPRGCFVFDKDGVLINTMPIFEAYGNRLYSGFNVTKPMFGLCRERVTLVQKRMLQKKEFAKAPVFPDAVKLLNDLDRAGNVIHYVTARLVCTDEQAMIDDMMEQSQESLILHNLPQRRNLHFEYPKLDICCRLGADVIVEDTDTTCQALHGQLNCHGVAIRAWLVVRYHNSTCDYPYKVNSLLELPEREERFKAGVTI